MAKKGEWKRVGWAVEVQTDMDNLNNVRMN